MSLKHGWGASALLLACLTAATWSQSARADGGYCPSGGCATGSCGTGGCATGDCGSCLTCCPKYYFTIEKAPKIRFKTVCSKPVCDQCNIEGNGYYPTCWRPWAYPPDYRHCPVPPPGVLASQPPPLMAAPGAVTGPELGQDDPLPAPRKSADPNPDR
jgi:hypothetical protein